MVKLLSILLFLLVLVFTSEAQIIVDNDTNKPVESVVITDGSRVVYSGINGRFDISLFTGDTVRFSHIAYLTKSLTLTMAREMDTLFLVPREIITDQVEINARKEEDFTVARPVEKVLNNREKEFYKNASSIVNKNTVLIIKDYGGYAGLKTVSARGLSGENTLVLFNEAKVNDIRTGSFDLSLVSPTTLGSVSYTGLATDEYSGPSAGGVLRLSTGGATPEHKVYLSAGLSSYEVEKYSAGFYTDLDNLNISVHGERSYGKNDYKYNYLGETHNRVNSFFSRGFLSGNINYSTSGNVLKVYSHYSSLTNGLPGFITANNFNSGKAVNSTKSFLTVVNDHLIISDRLLLNFNLNTHFQNIELFDPEGRLISIGTMQKSDLKTAGFAVKSIWKMSPLFRLNSGYRGEYSYLEGLSSFTTAADPPDFLERMENNIYTGIVFYREINNPVLSYIKLSALGAYTFVNEKIYTRETSDLFTGNGGAVFGLNLPFAPRMVFHYSSDTRIPTFNERYYSGLYNFAGLKNEEYTVFDAGLEAEYNKYGRHFLSLYYFRIEGKNKIIWIPYLSTLQVPRNINGIENNGLELNYNYSYPEYGIDAGVIYTYTKAENVAVNPADNSDGKQLIYTPVHSLKSNIGYMTGQFYFNVSLLYTGSRYYTSDNDPFSRLDPHFITDLSFSWRPEIFGTAHNFTLNIYNLFNKDYMVIQSYPMPGRTFSLSYKIEVL